jgi:hypothetical protein
MRIMEIIQAQKVGTSEADSTSGAMLACGQGAKVRSHVRQEVVERRNNAATRAVTERKLQSLRFRVLQRWTHFCEQRNFIQRGRNSS